MRRKSLDERIETIEAQLAGKTLQEHFREQAELIDRLFVYRFDQFEETWERKLEARFGRIETRLDRLDARVDQLEARFNQLEGRFDRLDTRFDTLEARFDKLEVRFDKLEARFDKLEAGVNAILRRLN